VTSGPGIHFGSLRVYQGFVVSTEYDPLLGKLIRGPGGERPNRPRLDRALAEFAITGTKANAALFRKNPERFPVYPM